MNEQQKRELMLRFAAENNGVWPQYPVDSIPNDKEPLVLLCKESYLEDVEYIEGLLYDGFDGFNKNLFDKVCTRPEFEELMQSLFEDAPDDAEYYLAPTGRTYPCWIKDLCADDDFCQYKVIIEDAMQSYTDKEWQRYNANKVLDGGVLIPRPRKHIDVDGLHNASVDGIKKAIEGDVVPSFSPAVEWSGNGLPPVGTVCEYKYAQVNEMEFKVGTIKFIGDKLVIIDSGYEQCYHIDSLEFRPLKTEAEKERERLHALLMKIFEANKAFKAEVVVDSIIEAGWRPND